MLFAVFPQVRVAFTGIAIYTWDVSFRAATVVGFFDPGQPTPLGEARQGRL